MITKLALNNNFWELYTINTRVSIINNMITAIIQRNELRFLIVETARYSAHMMGKYKENFTDYFIVQTVNGESKTSNVYKFSVSNYGFRQFKLFIYKEFGWIK